MHRTFFLLWVLTGTVQAQFPGQDPAFVNRLVERHRPQPGISFDVAAIGDQQYNPAGEAAWPALQDHINKSGVAFVIHTGDIKSGSTPCNNEMFANRLAAFNNFEMPMILTPGDNEWTDCYRENNGAFDPLERLAYLRRTFYPSNQSLGIRRMTLSQQSEDPRFVRFVENAIWSVGNVLFVSLHSVGSNNNLGRNAENDREYAERNAANIAWIRTAFAVARQSGFDGLLFVSQANPGFGGPRVKAEAMSTGFQDQFAVLEGEVVATEKPVLWVYGDSHTFRVGKPLLNTRTNRVLEKLVAVEVPGEQDYHWVRITVDAARSDIFSIQHMDVPQNLAPQR